MALFLGVGADDGDGVAELEDLVVAEDRPIPAVALVGREGDQAGDAVLALDILVGDDLVDAGHLSRPRLVSMEWILAWETLAWTRASCRVSSGSLQTEIGAVIAGAGDLGQGRGSRVFGAPDAAVGGNLESQSSSRLISPRRTLAASMTASTSCL